MVCTLLADHRQAKCFHQLSYPVIFPIDVERAENCAVGNLTADPELKQTPSGVSVCRFSIAVQRRFGRNEQGQAPADFFNIVTWRQQAEFVSRYFKKGNPILICGQIQTRSWSDNQGQKRYATEVIVDHAEFAQSKTEGSGTANEQATPSGNIDGFVPVDGERLPWE